MNDDCFDILHCDDFMSGTWTHFSFPGSTTSIAGDGYYGLYILKARLDDDQAGVKGKKKKKDKDCSSLTELGRKKCMRKWGGVCTWNNHECVDDSDSRGKKQLEDVTGSDVQTKHSSGYIVASSILAWGFVSMFMLHQYYLSL